MTQRRSLLAIYAHPDDEILGPGGTLARYAALGADVALVTATRGEAGEIQRAGTATPATLAEVRQQELICSAAELGIKEVIILNYRDSGMAGSADNEHPRAFVNVPAEVVVGRLVRIIRQLRPQVLLTFEPYGAYGHPDHIAVSRHTIAAFHAAGDPQRYPEQGEPWQPERLFYPILPASLIREIKARVAARGGDTSGYDEIVEGREQSEVWEGDEIHAILDVGEYVDRKWAAWECHQTQFGPNSRFRRLPEDEMKELLSREYFTLAIPEPPAAVVNHPLDGLFDALPGAEEPLAGTGEAQGG